MGQQEWDVLKPKSSNMILGGYLLGMAMRHFFQKHIDAHIRIFGHIRAYMRENLLLAHFPAPTWPSLVPTGEGI